MKQLILSLSLLLTTFSAEGRGEEWKQAIDPAELGFDVATLAEARALSEDAGTAAFMAIYRGQVVAAWGAVDRPLELHSVRKSLIGALFGTAIESGKINIAATLAELGIDDLAGLTDSERSARVQDLLASRSGIYLPAAYEAEENARSRPERGSHPPGSHWWYNNWDFNTLSTVYETATGKTVFEGLEEELSGPLGFEDFDLARDTFFHFERRETRHPAYLIRLSARDLARFGQLYLNRGSWITPPDDAAAQLIPAAWIQLSTAPSSPSVRGSSSYGLMWWVEAPGVFPSRPQLGSYSARGTGGQALIVVPEASMVFVHRGDTDHGRGVSGGAIWQIVDRILAAQGPAVTEEPRVQPLRSLPYEGAPPARPAFRTVETPQSEIDRLAGHYQIAPGVVAEIEAASGYLIGFFPGKGESDFFPVGRGRYDSRSLPVSLQFLLEEDQPVAVEMTLEGQAMTARRLEPASESVP